MRARWLVTALMVIGGLAVVVALVANDGSDDETKPATPIPDDPRPIPAAAALGDIDRVRVSGRTVQLVGWALDRDDPSSAAVRISIDGRFVTEVATTISRPDVAAAHRTDAARGFDVSIELDEAAPTTICVHTAPDDDLVTCERVAGDDHLGVLITPRKVMVRILEIRDNGYLVETPCGNRAVVAEGDRVRTTQILIDPGHGGSEVASVGPNGLGEKSLNLDVAKRAAKELRERGYAVELTRTTDVRLPIQIRAELANALDPDLFLSVHHNGGALARTPVPGTQVYYQHDDRQSRRLGGIMYEELFAAASEFPTAWVGNALDGVSTRLNDEGGDFYGIHRRTPEVTSLITEFLWLSNGAEAQLLARDDVRDAEAQALARGIDRWYRTEHSGSGYLRPFVDTFDSGGGGFEGCLDPVL